MDRISKEKRSWNMSRIKGKNTRPEIQLRSMLHRSGFRFRVHDRKLPGTPDIVLRKYNAVIQVHGCFWHRHKNCPETTMPKTRTEFWENKFAKTVERDCEQMAALKELDWNVITVWECEIRKDADSTLKKIISLLNKGERNA